MTTKRQNRNWIVPLGIVVVGVLIYSNTFLVPFYFDDYYTIVDNYQIKQLFNVAAIWRFDPSRFLTHLSFAVNFRWGGLNPWGYHAVNLVLHLMVSLLAWMLLKVTWGGKGRSTRENAIGRIVVVAGFIFLCHPIQTQAVTYIAQRSTLLASLFYLATIICYVFYRRGNWWCYPLALGLMFLGLFTKPIIITLPFALLLYEVFFFDFDPRRAKKVIALWTPFLILALLVPLLLILWRYRNFEMDHIYAMTRETVDLTRKEYLLTQFNVLMTYIRLLFVPVRQTMDYDYPIAHSFFSFPTWLSFLVLCGIFWVGVRMFRRQKMVAFGIFWMLLTLSLESSIFPISDVIFEHRLYLPMVGFALILSFLLNAIPAGRARMATIIMVLLILSGLTYRRNQVWGDMVAFHQDNIKKFPNKARLRNNLANIYYKMGDYENAERGYLQALAIEEDYADAYNNLANVYVQQRKVEEAIAALEKSIALDPNYAGAYFNLGHTYYFEKKDKEKAGEYFVKTLEINPNFAQAMLGLGRIYLEKDDFIRAKFYFAGAIHADPHYAPSYANMGDLCAQLRQFELARDYYLETIKREPYVAVIHNNLGNVYDILGDPQQAIYAYKNAIALDPGYVSPYINLNQIYQREGNIGLAREMGEIAQRIIQEMGEQGFDQKTIQALPLPRFHGKIR